MAFRGRSPQIVLEPCLAQMRRRLIFHSQVLHECVETGLFRGSNTHGAGQRRRRHDQRRRCHYVGCNPLHFCFLRSIGSQYLQDYFNCARRRIPTHYSHEPATFFLSPDCSDWSSGGGSRATMTETSASQLCSAMALPCVTISSVAPSRRSHRSGRVASSNSLAKNGGTCRRSRDCCTWARKSHAAASTWLIIASACCNSTVPASVSRIPCARRSNRSTPSCASRVRTW